MPPDVVQSCISRLMWLKCLGLVISPPNTASLTSRSSFDGWFLYLPLGRKKGGVSSVYEAGITLETEICCWRSSA